MKKYNEAVDRKELQRAYKETKHPIGVYRIQNKVNGKTIIGTSVNLLAILNRHRAGLRMGGHEIRELQKDWNEHGADAFEFEILDQLTPIRIRIRLEQQEGWFREDRRSGCNRRLDSRTPTRPA